MTEGSNPLRWSSGLGHLVIYWSLTLGHWIFLLLAPPQTYRLSRTVLLKDYCRYRRPLRSVPPPTSPLGTRDPPPRLRELSVALVGDRQMAELHEQFLNVRRPPPTCSTFPLEVDRQGRVTAGEVVVCLPEARRRARIEGVPVEREVLLYALHGMLHLAGFDDRTAPDFATMHRTEDDILTRIGVGPVFSGPREQVGKGGIPSRTVRASRGARRPARRTTIGGPARPPRPRPTRATARRPGKAAGPNGAQGRRS